MDEKELELKIDDLKRVGGYAQAKLLLKNLPKDVQDALKSNKRSNHIIEIKQKVIVLLKDRYELSFPAIAELLRYKEHTSVMHHYHKVKRAHVSPEKGKQI